MTWRRSGLGLAVLLAACSEAREAPPLRVEVMGCVEWPRGEACALGTAPLTLWIERPAEVAIDGETVAISERVPVQGGLRLRVSVRPGRLTVTAKGRRPYVLPLVAATPDPRFAAVARLRRSGALTDAETLVAQITATSTPSGALAEAARNALAAGRDVEASRLFDASIAVGEREGRPRAVLRDRTALVYVIIEGGFPPGRARRELDALAPLAQRHAEAAADLAYSQAYYASKMRAPRPGLAAVRELLARAERLGLDESELDGRQMRVALLVLAGRWAEVAEELSRVRATLSTPWSACKRGELLANLGWYQLLGYRASPEHFPEPPQPILQQAVVALKKDCPRPTLLATAEVNLGWAALFAGQLDEVRVRLGAAEAADPTPSPRARLDRQHLEAELLLAAEQHRGALDAFVALEARAAQVGLPFIGWRAAVGRGMALEGLSDLPGAIRAYQDAEHRLAALAERVPLGEGRDGLLFERGESAERLVDALTRADRGVEAIEAIRRARRGVLSWSRGERALLLQPVDEERDATQARLRAARAALVDAVAESWALPADALARDRAALDAKAAEARAALDAFWSNRRDVVGATALGAAPTPLPTPRPGDASLFVHPVGQGMVAWLWTSTGLWSATSTQATPAQLRPLAPRLAGITRLEVYASPVLESLDWAGWRVDEAPLFRRTEVVFPLDLGRVEPVAAPEARPRALVVADPAGALPRAQDEGRAVARVLKRRGFDVVALIGPTERNRVLEVLGQPWDLMHYSGHGEQDGLDGVEGGLVMQAGLRISVTDVLALPRAPRRVILVACDLGRRGSREGRPGLGMTQAFVLRGSEQVVAALRPVRDQDATQWLGAFLDAWSSSQDFGPAVRAARAALAEDRPEVDAAAFRVWTSRARTRAFAAKDE
ncbi:MAG: CHAT domain-containing protein [Deltaproteobacteria bacterium]